jgi:hypothetical protein
VSTRDNRLTPAAHRSRFEARQARTNQKAADLAWTIAELQAPGVVIPRLAAPSITSRRFPAPWRAEPIRAAMSLAANGQAVAYLYSRDNEDEARQAKVLAKDEARRIAANIPRLPKLLGKTGD